MKIQPRNSHGAALVITLAILVLITILIVSLFLTITNERGDSAASTRQAEAQWLAGSVVDLVKSTISQATTGYESDASTGTPDTARRTAWASQPGLIRTWNQSGNFYRAFRLYSSGNILVSNPADLVTDTTEIASWKSGAPSNAGSYNALWCDLNAPVLNQANERIYPIVTPPADSRSGSAAVDAANGIATDDPATPVQEGVQGFSVLSAPGYSGSNPSPANNPAPMPVKWLYVLQDGSFVSPVGDGTTVTVTGASQANPIIGRVAYWTDDETAKVNINTASEGVMWDVPRAEGSVERDLGRFQPVRNEFQRYPGHPALTSLSAVFPAFGKSGKTAADWESIYDILPRTNWGMGGSRAGTVRPLPLSAEIPIKNDRLFVSPEELLYTPGSTPRTAQTLLDADTIKRSQFFLTASSRAPETTLFETPRISLWPQNTQAARQDGFDRTLAFCATINNEPFYFQRQNSKSHTNDFANIARNRELYAYLQDLTGKPIPGYGGNFAAKFGNDRNQILTQIFDYVRSGPNLIGAGLPRRGLWGNGFVDAQDSFAGWFGTVIPIQIGTTRGFGRYVSFKGAGLAFYCEGIDIDTDAAGNPAPGRTRYKIRPYLMIELFSPAQGFDTFRPEVDVRITGGLPTIAPGPAGAGTGGTIDFPLNTDRRIFIPDNFGLDYSGYFPSVLSTQYFTRIPSGASGPQRRVLLRSSAFSFDYPTPDITPGVPFNSTQVRRPGGPPFFADFAFSDDLGEKEANQWLVSFRTTRDPNLRFVVSPARELTLELRNPQDSAVLQRAAFNFNPDNIPGGLTLPLPFFRFDRSWQDPEPSPRTTPLTKDEADRLLADFDNRRKSGSSWNSQGGDVIRGVEIDGTSGVFGDTRLVFTMDSIPANLFRPANTADYYNPNVTHSHSFRALYGSTNTGYNPLNPATRNSTDENRTLKPTAGLLVAGTRYISTTGPSGSPIVGFFNPATWARPVSSNLNGATMSNGRPGDWDNATGRDADGPFINRPDLNALGRLQTGPPVERFSYFNLPNLEGTAPDAEGVSETNQYGLVYSPNRQMFSAFQLGSLPSRAVAGNPWETLLFNPVPASRDGTSISHRGDLSPKDHLLADNFWMPIVDPYPISEPFSTAGKINLNTAIAPFSNIRRETGLAAALKPMSLAAFDTRPAPASVTAEPGNPLGYKGYGIKNEHPIPSPVNINFRYPLDVDKTLRAFRDRGVFKSATEIAEVPLYPTGTSSAIAYNTDHSDLYAWWADQKMTGDNTREMPYAQLLPRITTKSNTFTVHLRVQALKQVPGWRQTASDWDEWDERRDQVVSEYRGSTTIERYVDPNDPTIPDFADASNFGKNLAPYYQWRTLSEQQFVP